MNAFAKTLAMTCVALVTASAFAKRPDTEGARIGVWTQDYDAAAALATSNNLPLLINFTGSDWCGWCKLMDRKVFSTDEWKKWASKNIVLAFIDFPQNDSLVPKKYVARNRKLAESYGVRGYPTYVVVNPADGKTLGTLGASRSATPAGFISDLENLLLALPDSSVAKTLAKSLSAEDLKRLDSLRSEKAAAEKAIETFGEKAQAELTGLQQAIQNAADKDAKAAAEIAFKSRLADLQKEFEPLQAKAEKAGEELTELLKKARASNGK